MINGIIKLFYSEIVRTKMRSMPSDNYTLREECKDIQNITLKIDSIFLKTIKFIIATILLYLAFNINVILGIGVFLIEISYIAYKRNLEKEIREHMDNIKNNIKNNIEASKVNLLTEKGKKGIELLITLLLIGFLTKFNWAVIISFIVVFMFTIKDIYSNIK